MKSDPAAIMDVASVCRTFPQLPEPLIERTNVLETLEDMFEGGAQLVALEGEEGIGKTTLLAQFALRHSLHTIALFARATSRLAYDPWYLQFDLCNQLEWFIHQQELDPQEEIDEAKRRIQITYLQGRARRESWPYYVVLDGLDEIPDDDGHLRQYTLNLLPLGIPGFRFLMACKLEGIPSSIRNTMACRSYRVTRLSLDESIKFFSAAGIDLERGQVEDLRHICQGIPGRLASVRRTLAGGVNVQALLDDMPTEITQLLELEWHLAVQNDNEFLTSILAVLAHDQAQQTVSSLASIHRRSESEITGTLRLARFICVSPNGDVTFVSTAFKNFAARKLADWKRRVNTLIIDQLSRSPESTGALAQLPIYLAQEREFERLFEYLSPQHLVQLVERNQSLGPALKSAELGLQSALQVHRDSEVSRLSLSRMLFRQFEVTGTARVEIEALMSVGDYDGAIALAQDAILKEDRLELLALVAKSYHLRKEEVPRELLDQLNQLVEEVDTSSLGDRAVRIAQDLIYSNPDQALQMVEAAMPPVSGERGLDHALALISFSSSAITGVLGAPSDHDAALKQVTARMRDPRARGLTEAVSVLLSDDSATAVMVRVAVLDSIRDRIFILRKWAAMNRERQDGWEVVDAALKAIVSSSQFSPNAGVYRDLAEPIPYISDEETAKRLIGQFDSQRDIIRQQGPTQDYVRLQLTLAKAEFHVDSEAAYSRFFETYMMVEAIADIAIRAECTAWLVSFVAGCRDDVAGTSLLSAKDCELVRREFSQRLAVLLDSTADHYEVTRPIIHALAGDARDLALEVAVSLNTEDRRNNAIWDLIEAVAVDAFSRDDSGFLQQAMTRLTDPLTAEHALCTVLERMAEVSEDETFPFDEFAPFIQQCSTMENAGLQSCALRYAYVALANAASRGGTAGERYRHWADSVLAQMQRAWEEIDVGWERVEVGFRHARSLASVDMEAARSYIRLADEYRDEITVESWNAADVFGMCLSLVIRAFAGLLPSHLETQANVLQLERLIDSIPSSGERAAKWGFVALLAYARKQETLARSIIADHIKPVLDDIQGGHAYRHTVLRVVAPALWCYHSQTAKDLIAQVPARKRDDVYVGVAYFLLHKLPPLQHTFARLSDDYSVTYEELTDLCSIASDLSSDRSICWIISEISSCIRMGRKVGRYTREQQRVVLDRLRPLLDKLPDQNNIRHDGYKLLAEAQLLRIDGGRQNAKKEWSELVERAQRIPNASDRAYVLSKLALAIPDDSTLCHQVLLQTGKIVADLQSHAERVDRYITVAEDIIESEVAERQISLAREYLSKAMAESSGTRDDNSEEAQRHIIDVAYQFDENLAQSLASQADDDPARLKERIQLNQLSRNISEPQQADIPTRLSDLSRRQQELIANAAWRSLLGINEKSRDWVRLEHIRHMIEMAADLPLELSYPLVAWAIEHAIYRYAADSEADARLRHFFDSSVSAAELALQLGARASDRAKRVKQYSIAISTAKTGLVRAGDRQAAFRYIRNWFEEHVEEYLKIADPYFCLEDLEWVRMLGDVIPSCRVQVLTSRRSQQSKVELPWEDTYNLYWKLKISDREPPETEIVIAGTKQQSDSPIHDRFLITKGGGLAIGTSLNALGVSKDAKITILSKGEAEEVEHDIDQCLNMGLRMYRGERVQYIRFNLLADG